MKGKILFLVGLAIGYVFGTRDGRERYLQIRRTAKNLWDNPTVQSGVSRAEEYVRSAAPEVVERVEQTAKKVVEQVKSRTAPKSGQADD